MNQYYDNTTDDFFHELNNDSQINFQKNDSNQFSNSSQFERNTIYNNQDLRLTQSTPRINLTKTQKRSNSTSRAVASSPVFSNSNNNFNNETMHFKNEISEINQNTEDINSKYSMFDTQKKNSINPNKMRKTQNYKFSSNFQKNKYNNVKTQKSNKKKLAISDSISIDYYYSKIISFEVDPQSLHVNFHKRTKLRKNHENIEQPLNFISKYIPNVEPNPIQDENNKDSSKTLSITSDFSDEAQNCWQLTLQRFRSMKSTKAVFNSIRLSEFKHYHLTQLLNQDENDQTGNTIDENQLLKFKFFLSQPNQEKRKKDSDVIHLYLCHRLAVDPKKIVSSLTNIYQNNLNNIHPDGNENLDNFKDIDDCINRILHYIIVWISLFPTDFSTNQKSIKSQKKKKNASPSFVEDLSELISLIITSFPKYMNSSMTILAVIYFIYNGELNSLMISHFPCLKHKISDKKIFGMSNLIDLQTDAQVLAKHFAYVELHFLRNITRNDIISEGKWMKSSNLQEMFKRFNDTCSFIISSIIKSNKEDQIQKISYWIAVMSESMKIRNYQLMFEIETALSSSLLNEVKSNIPLNLNLKFEKMKTFLYSKRYNEDLLKRKEVCIPFFGIVFKKILKLLRKKNISFEQIQQKKLLEDIHIVYDFVDMVEFFFSEWGTQYFFDLDSSLLQAINDLNGKIVSVDELNEFQQ